MMTFILGIQLRNLKVKMNMARTFMSVDGRVPVCMLMLLLLLRMGALPLQRNDLVQNHRKSALMHILVLSVFLDTGVAPKIRAVFACVRSSG
jgi:uncharacterized membrane protein